MQSSPKRASVGLFVDGNALFRAIDELNEPSLKWLDLQSLGRSLIVEDVVISHTILAFCSTSGDRAIRAHERAFLNILQARGVVCIGDDGVREFHECSRCGHGWDEKAARRNEAELAVALLDGAWDDQFDHAILIGDHWDWPALERRFTERFTQKTLTIACLRPLPRTSLAPPNIRRRVLTKKDLRAHPLADKVKGPRGETISRPRDWAPGASARWSDLEITGL